MRIFENNAYRFRSFIRIRCRSCCADDGRRLCFCIRGQKYANAYANIFGAMQRKTRRYESPAGTTRCDLICMKEKKNSIYVLIYSETVEAIIKQNIFPVHTICVSRCAVPLKPAATQPRNNYVVWLAHNETQLNQTDRKLEFE